MTKQNIPSQAERLYRTHFPYGIRKMPSGKYFVFNREYQPIGQAKRTLSSVHTDDVPEDLCIHLDISDRVRAVLAVPHSDQDFIYLYNDRTNPIQGGESLTMYMDKLRVLMELKAW